MDDDEEALVTRLAVNTDHLNRLLEVMEGSGVDPLSACLQYAAELAELWRNKKCPRDVKLAFLTAMYGETGRLIGELARQDDRVRAWQEAVPTMQTIYRHGERIT